MLLLQMVLFALFFFKPDTGQTIDASVAAQTRDGRTLVLKPNTRVRRKRDVWVNGQRWQEVEITAGPLTGNTLRLPANAVEWSGRYEYP